GRGEGDPGERVDGLLLEALRGWVGGGSGVGASASACASGDKGEAEDADESAEQRRQDDSHVRVDRRHWPRLLLLRMRRRQRGRRRRWFAGAGCDGHAAVQEGCRRTHGVAG
uniref:Uncharacterized protein n=1 Tax=Triticum urartu TaxID=4572 RepID=A0A8R7VCJ8_TRIUA